MAYLDINNLIDIHYTQLVSCDWFTFSLLEFKQVSTVSALESWFPGQIDAYKRISVIQEDEIRPGNLIIGTNSALLSLPLEPDGVGVAIAGPANSTGKT